MPTDISVTISPPNSTSVTIGGVSYPHANTHLPNGSDPITGFATYQQLIGVSGLMTTASDVVDLTSNQNISGEKNFTSRPTVNGTGVLLSGEASIGDTGYLTGYVQKVETGNFVVSSQTGSFYPISNPSGYITGVDLSAYQTIVASTGISGYLQGQVNSLNASTGSFITTGVGDSRYYPLSSNPSLYLVAADLINYSTIDYVTGVSGHLQSQISSINLIPLQNATGNLDLRVQTLEGQSGQWLVGYNDSITGIAVVGTSSKTNSPESFRIFILRHTLFLIFIEIKMRLTTQAKTTMVWQIQ